LEDIITRGRGRHDNLAQLYRRQSLLKLHGISMGEAKLILKQYNVTPNVAVTLAKVAEDVKHGGMGTFAELVELCLSTAEGRQITEDILDAAMRHKMMWTK
jgi:hypothetical protein